MNCPQCQQEMQPGIVWLGVLSTSARVLFSPSSAVSWIRRRLAGTIFNGPLRDGEVEILSREWTDQVSARTAYHCKACELITCDVRANQQPFPESPDPLL